MGEMRPLNLTIWGARGSRPIPGPGTLKYGGNTSCLTLSHGDRCVILDAGTGICDLAKRLEHRGEALDMDILITHTHWDHIMGIPFFTPLYKKKNTFRIHGVKSGNVSFKDQVSAIMVDPHFPVRFDQLASRYELIEFEGGKTFTLYQGSPSEMVVKTLNNNHPNGGVSYRVEVDGRSICYVTDYECSDYSHFELLAKFIEGCDLFVFDANYTDDEYYGRTGEGSKVGWGHSTWQMAVALAKTAGVGRCCLFHHNTDRTDDMVDAIEAEAAQIFDRTFAAREGMVIEL